LSQPALVGALSADDTFTARYLHWAGSRTDTVAALRAIWANSFGRDTAIAALLRHDWSSLCPACRHREPPAATIGPVARPQLGDHPHRPLTQFPGVGTRT
jgi:hypothetical protein